MNSIIIFVCGVAVGFILAFLTVITVGLGMSKAQIHQAKELGKSKIGVKKKS